MSYVEDTISDYNNLQNDIVPLCPTPHALLVEAVSNFPPLDETHPEMPNFCLDQQTRQKNAQPCAQDSRYPSRNETSAVEISTFFFRARHRRAGSVEVQSRATARQQSSLQPPVGWLRAGSLE